MTQHIKNDDCTPRLRFPEFVNYNIWEKTIISDILNLNYGKSQSSHSLENGNIPIIGSSGIMGYTNQFISKGPSLIIGRKGTVGSIIYFDGPSYPIDTTYYISFKKNNISTKFIFYILHCININSCRNESAVPGLSKKNLYLMSICLPSKQEQQKIADCLTSLDDLITAHEQKAEALRQHKKGLMQRLLPAEGETTPRWRFPEFREAGEWSTIYLGDTSDFLSGFPFPSKDMLQNKKGYKLLRGVNITEGSIRHHSDIDKYFCGNIKDYEKYKLKSGDIVIGMDGSKVGKNSALIGEKDENSLLVQRIARLRVLKNFSANFIYQNIRSKRFFSYVDKINSSSGIPHISGEQIKKFTIASPLLPEQQKIADCLSALDERITAQEAKVTALREHKKGLMQRLFPQAM